MLLALFLTGTVQQGAAAPGAQQTTVLSHRAAMKLVTHLVRPAYPPIAKVNYVQGVVKLRVTVNSKGKVAEVHVLEGEPLLAASALKAVRKWRFRPYVSSDGPTPFTTVFGISFRLHPHVFGTHLPNHANRFLRKQISPPKVASRPQGDPPAEDAAKFRLLVNSKGKLLDVVPMEGKESDAKLAKRNLRRWKFLPAHWGAIAVPWYLIVKVPLVHALVDRAANSTGR